MRRLSWGYQILEEDAKNIGVEEVLTRIVNLAECEDGLYAVETCNPSYDWESGYLDSYDYQLVPFVLDKAPQLPHASSHVPPPNPLPPS